MRISSSLSSPSVVQSDGFSYTSDTDGLRDWSVDVAVPAHGMGIASFAGIMFVLPPLMNVLPTSWNDAASPYLPLAAGEAIMSITPGNHLAPWAGLGLFTAYAAAAIAVAALLLRRRDV